MPHPFTIAKVMPLLPEFQSQDIGGAESYDTPHAADKDYPLGTRGAIYSMNDMSRMGAFGLDNYNRYWDMLEKRKAYPMSFEIAPPPIAGGKIPIHSALTPQGKAPPGSLTEDNDASFIDFHLFSPQKVKGVKPIAGAVGVPSDDESFLWKTCSTSTNSSNMCDCGTIVRYGAKNGWLGAVHMSEMAGVARPRVKCTPESFGIDESKAPQAAECQCAHDIWKFCAKKGETCDCATQVRHGLEADGQTSIASKDRKNVCNAKSCYCASQLQLQVAQLPVDFLF
eukprot:GEMP01075343.1.p1 GENE.GEMP01075343.1~~GEMP01075343.1.p1  ORF type:complete len:282 (+),score=54.09 GEMP01075343.1:142-987(+)